jgi:hypothetical protein
MATPKLTKPELAKLLDDVTNDFGTLLAKAESETPEMAKADPGEESPGEKTPPGSSAEEPKKEESSPAPEAHKEPDGDEAPPAAEQTPDEATEQGVPEQTLEAQYSALPVEELKLHFVACKTALMAALGAAGGPPADGATPPPPAPPTPAPEATASPAPQPGFGKKEFPAAEGSGGEMKLGKSEADIKLESRLETLEKALKEKDDYIKDVESKFSAAAEGLTKLINSQPMRKSIAGVSFVAREDGVTTGGTQTPTLTKAEAIAKCNEISARPDLKKSDRELLNKFVTGNCAQDQIAHLLTIK